MNKQYDQVKEFHEAFNQKMPDMPCILERGRTAYDRLILKDTAFELLAACRRMKNGNISSEVMKRASWMLEELIEFMQAENTYEQVDALTDLIYFAVGTFTLMGIKPEPFFDIVHAANMGKLHEDGKPRYDKQGKIVKPNGWQAKYAPEPKIINELRRQSAEIYEGEKTK
ncbi:hypothetical protein BK126_03110 [Paenibacillus sp. FSL H7-0326]|uniref:hypothetical protein n=1 Tax=Paenibacillus sp. FSL H7-0326 TaxID=1921144 RepID=UPI00096CCA13|nr:hypothetical protein [Paenibacillus sp. FSL H7-0326]OMC71117.1 hypothetical protein BK126_03110 [Paenibacillus sp. FSL H7-0326]